MDQKTLKKLLDYDQDTGVFTWLVKPSKRIHVGATAGHKTKLGYIDIGFQRSHYGAHRLAWLYVHGSWPDGIIDHINGDPSDNRIANLRQASVAENRCNSKPKKTNPSGLKSVTKAHGRWQSQIKSKGKTHYLGLFDCPAAAHFAYQIAADKMHGPYARVF